MEDLFQHVYMEGCSKWKPDGVLNKVQSKADTIWISNCNWSCKERHVQRFQPLMTGLAFILVPLSEDSVTEPAIALVTCRFKAEAGSNAGVRSFRHQSFRIMSFQVHSAVEIFFFHPFLLQFQLVELVLALFSLILTLHRKIPLHWDIRTFKTFSWLILASCLLWKDHSSLFWHLSLPNYHSKEFKDNAKHSKNAIAHIKWKMAPIRKCNQLPSSCHHGSFYLKSACMRIQYTHLCEKNLLSKHITNVEGKNHSRFGGGHRPELHTVQDL